MAGVSEGQVSRVDIDLGAEDIPSEEEHLEAIRAEQERMKKQGVVPALEEELRAEQDEEIAQEGERNEERRAHPSKAAKGFLFASVIVTLFIALIAAVRSDSGVVYAFLGFAPTILCILIFIGLLEGDYRDVLFWFTPLVICVLFLLLGPYLDVLVANQLDVPVLTAVNLALSYLLLLLMTIIQAIAGRAAMRDVSLQEIEKFEPAKLDQYIHTIEDKCKAINFVIGRVYRASNGGVKEMREKLRVPSEWYNEFNAIKPEAVKEQKELALDILKRIQERLSDLLRPEKDVFTPAEIKGLKHLARDRDGKDRVIDVLTVNDQDPVEDYFLGAMDFCKRITTELEKL
jgi:hypothetical protein